MTRRTPQPGDSYSKGGREFCRVVELDCYNNVIVTFHGGPGRVIYPLVEFHRLIDAATWSQW